MSESGTEIARTVGEVAALTGVSVRTLHHYDHVGLVVPSQRSAAGYRHYVDADVERLLQVLTYRELGFPLEQIATLLDDPGADPMAHLRRQHRLLVDRIEHLHHMVVAVEAMMSNRTNGINLSAAEQAEIFGDNWMGDEYAVEAQERWGDTDAWAQSRARTAAFTKGDWQRVKDDTEALEVKLAQALRRGVVPGGAEANALAEEHRAAITQFYDCDHSMQVCLAQMYVADERFTAHYDEREPGLARFLHDIIVANAETR